MASKGPLHFTVWGSGDFPFDMLRYDSCCPHESVDAGNMHPSYYAGRPECRSVVIRTYSPRAPTVQRWESFGWRVDRGVDRDAHLRRANVLREREAV